MKKVFITITVLLGMVFIITGIALLINPEWLIIRGGWIILLGAIFVTIAGLGEGLKGWVNLFFGETTKLTDELKSLSKKNGKARVNFTKNTLFGRNKIQISQNDTEVSSNKIIGENEIDITENQKNQK